MSQRPALTFVNISGGLHRPGRWVGRGARDRHKKYKGIFIGNSAREKKLEDRPNPYADGWVKSLEASGYVAIATVELYQAYVAHLEGKLDTEAFWRAFFKTNGVFDIQPFLK